MVISFINELWVVGILIIFVLWTNVGIRVNTYLDLLPVSSWREFKEEANSTFNFNTIFGFVFFVFWLLASLPWALFNIIFETVYFLFNSSNRRMGK